MSRRKKKLGCIGGMIQFCVILIGIGIIVSVVPVAVGGIIVVGVIYFIIAIIKWAIGAKSPLANINYDNMTGQEFENFCAKVLKYNGFSNVVVTKGSGDHGIDILANKGGMRYAIQCKCYSENVGNKAVQEAYSGRAIYGADIAVVMTNRNFTKQAEIDARKLSVQLWGRNKLQSLINLSRDKNDKSKKAKEDSYDFSKIERDLKKDNSREDTKRLSRNTTYSKEFIENYARYCNAYLEHEDEMDQYKRLQKPVNQKEDVEAKTTEETLKILDIEEKVVAIEDGEISKALYRYLDSASRIAIDMFLKNGDGNPHTDDMIKNVESPILLYNAKFTKLTKCVMHFVYYCNMNPNFNYTPTYAKLRELSKIHNRKYNDDLFKIDVYYNVEDIVLENKEIKINKVPEVNISTDDMEGIKLLEDIEDFDLQTGHNILISEIFFPIKTDNVRNN